VTRMAGRDAVLSTVRSVRWTVPLVAYGLVALTLAWRRADLSDPSSALAVARVVGVITVVGVLPLLDDPATGQVAAVPVPLWIRELPRLIAMTFLVLVPLGLLAVATDLPLWPVLLELGAILALAAATALLVQQATDQVEPSTLVSVGVLVLPVAMYLLPSRFTFFVSPGPAWVDAHLRWAVLLAVGVLLTTYALRDPASPPVRRVGRRRGTSLGPAGDCPDHAPARST
jgi:hypothetical protein